MPNDDRNTRTRPDETEPPAPARPRVLIGEPDGFSAAALAVLRQTADVECRAIAQADVRAALTAYDALWVRLHLQVRAADIPEIPRCRAIVSATTGVDHLDLVALERHGVTVVCLRGHTEFLRTLTSTAELTLALILGLVRRLPAAVGSVKDGTWDRDRFRGRELRGLNAGIVGYGRLGRCLGDMLLALGMHVTAYDPHVPATAYAPPATGGVRRAATLEELLADADIVSLHVPLNEETRGLMGARELSTMKPGAYLVNTSRGAVIDEAALLNALRDGRLAGAGLDVLCGEPAIEASHPLVAYARQHENLLITPHVGGATREAMDRAETYVAGLVAETLRETCP